MGCPYLTWFDTFSRDMQSSDNRILLVDLRGVTRYDLDFDQMHRLTTQVAPFYSEQGLRKVIYAPDDIGYGMTRMFQSLADAQVGLDIEIVRSEREALDAVGARDDRSINDLMARNRVAWRGPGRDDQRDRA